jgi:hypothetical protein
MTIDFKGSIEQELTASRASQNGCYCPAIEDCGVSKMIDSC